VIESPDMNPPGSEIQLYLASNSPRRRELLSIAGFGFKLLPVQVDETPLPDEQGIDYVKRIASHKALAACVHQGVQGVIISADTAVIGLNRDGATEIYGKPKDPAEAIRMLRRLRGQAHQVITAIKVLRTQDGTGWLDSCITEVPMRAYSDAEINAYVATGDPMDKAGAYAIQHAGFHPVENLQGCYANVMGLPLCHLTRCLNRLGIFSPVNVPQACQAALGYNCFVYPQILKP
jgi:septum formation protein